MGFNKLYIPSVLKLEEEIESFGKEEFYRKWVKRYVKADAIFGSQESLDFIKQFLTSEYDIDRLGSNSYDTTN